jgi:hypothetical protein
MTIARVELSRSRLLLLVVTLAAPIDKLHYQRGEEYQGAEKGRGWGRSHWHDWHTPEKVCCGSIWGASFLFLSLRGGIFFRGGLFEESFIISFLSNLGTAAGGSCGPLFVVRRISLIVSSVRFGLHGGFLLFRQVRWNFGDTGAMFGVWREQDREFVRAEMRGRG